MCKEEVKEFSKISREAFYELAIIVPEAESKLKQAFDYDKINWVMYMMHDPEVHFHIIPRYASHREFEKITFKDPRWLYSPKLTLLNEISSDVLDKLIAKLKILFSE
jgi:diadenosine tetraphosphate (Ap4A) HIT family hydrolase